MRFPMAVACLIAGLSVPLAAQHWPHWRGPSASGLSSETGLPVQWSDSTGVAWKASIRGLGISSPIVWGDRVFVTSQVGRGEFRAGPRLVQSGDAASAGERSLGGGGGSGGPVSFLITAIDRATGKRAWEHETRAAGPLPSVHDKHNLASPSPVTDGARVYAWYGTGQLVAVDLTGKLVWQKHLGAEYGSFEINWGHGSSPVVHRDTVFLLCYHEPKSYLLALDSRTGAVRWKSDAESGVTSYSTPLVVENGALTEVIVNSSDGLSAYDASSGRRLWFVAEQNRFPIPMPLYQDGIIYASRGYRSSPFMAIRPGGKGNVAATNVVWRAPSGGPYISSLVYYDGLIYMVGDVGVLTVTDAKTGRRVFQERIGGVYTASPIAADGRIYLVSEDGETTVVAAGRTPRVVARNRLNARLLASPAIAGGRLFLRSDDAVYAIGK
jgi:outer membrane protein assembly factor BamB